MESKENETDKERKSEDIVDEEIERRCLTKTKITQHLSTYNMPSGSYLSNLILRKENIPIHFRWGRRKIQ